MKHESRREQESSPIRHKGIELSHQSSTTSRFGLHLFSAVVFLIPTAVVLAATWQFLNIVWIFVAVLVGLLFYLTIHIAHEWEKAVIMRLGKYNRVAGPGVFLVIPIVESLAAIVDQRIRTTSFNAEETLSSDLVPVNVDCVLFWVIWDAERACKEVRNFEYAVSYAAQTAMRDVIGQICLSEIAMRRQYLDEELKRIIMEKVDDWGIAVVSVEIRDIVIPKELQQGMARQAQAERERDARVTLAEVEKDISELYAEAAAIYGQPEKALALRTMNLVYDSVKETGSMVVVPSSYSEGFNDAATEALKEVLK
jgi:regulator of protease activity HflC (stomatin/prohibitin superfamily)